MSAETQADDTTATGATGNGSATPARSIATIPTDKASRYLQQLAKHFAHKLPVSFTPETGDIPFPFGNCHMDAGEGRLTLTLTTPDGADMPRLQQVVVNHLARFAFREEIAVEWQAA